MLPESPATVIVEFASLAFAIEPANSSLLTPPFLIVTAPDDTAKLSELNDAIPFAEVDASEPAIVTVLLPSSTDVSIPVPPIIPNWSDYKVICAVEELSSAIVSVLLTSPNDKPPEPSVFSA